MSWHHNPETCFMCSAGLHTHLDDVTFPEFYLKETPMDEKQAVNEATSFPYKDVVVDTLISADRVIEHINQIILQYGTATVKDLATALDIEPVHSDGKYGWDLNLWRTAKSEVIKDGDETMYRLVLPDASYVDIFGQIAAEPLADWERELLESTNPEATEDNRPETATVRLDGSVDGMLLKAKRLVCSNYNIYYRKQMEPALGLDDVYIITFSKTLQNWKALLSTKLADDRVYEVTYNGDKKEAYVDTYKKETNIAFPDSETYE